VRTVEQHQSVVRALVEEALARRPVETLPVDPARIAAEPERHRRRVLAADVVAPLDLPPFANSQMDGYALTAVDAARPGSVDLVVVDPIPAGRTGPVLRPGTAAPIMTGAAVPEGAVAVVPIEQAEPPVFPAEGSSARVVLEGPVAEGTFVRAAGSDVAAGSVLLPAGTVLTPARWGVLAASGLASVPLVRRPRLLLVSTGEELAAPGEPLAPGTIHDANGASLTAALVDVGVDVVVGDAFESAGVTFGHVAMQPGGPQGWGRITVHDRVLPVVCFPGNPVSALVSFEAFLRPVLHDDTGVGAARARHTAVMAEAADSPVGKHQLRRGRLDVDGRVVLVGGPSSHLLAAHAAASVLVHVPIGVDRLDEGDEVVVWALDE
jgi:molybdopterin molybdotransferase